MNSTQLIGRIANDIEVRYTQSGIAFTSFNLAVDRKYKNASGERETDFIPCSAWRKTAELIGEHFHKGSRIGITGCLQVEKWEARDGTKRQTVKVVIENIDFIDLKKDGGATASTSGTASKYENSSNGGHDPVPPPFEEGDDELPF